MDGSTNDLLMKNALGDEWRAMLKQGDGYSTTIVTPAIPKCSEDVCDAIDLEVGTLLRVELKTLKTQKKGVQHSLRRGEWNANHKGGECHICRDSFMNIELHWKKNR